MKIKTCVLLSVCIWIAACSFSFAATIPAATTLVVQTVNSLAAQSRVGLQVKVQLAHDVAVGGKIVLKAGTPATAEVKTAIGDFRRSDHVSLDLTAISAGGRMVSVKTTGAYELQPSSGHRTSRGATVYGRNFVFPHGTHMTFQLAQPVNL